MTVSVHEALRALHSSDKSAAAEFINEANSRHSELRKENERLRAVEFPAKLNIALREILGMPNFECGPIAHALRDAGRDIPRKSEAEQAFVLHWLTTLALKHGRDWKKHAADELDRATKSPTSPSDTRQDKG